MTEPTPEAFPVPADVLAEAEEWCRSYGGLNATEAAMLADILMAEYERRGRIVEAATALVDDSGSVWFEGTGASEFLTLLDVLAMEVHGDV